MKDEDEDAGEFAIVFTTDLYKVTTNTDTNEGRDQYRTHWFRDQSVACQAGRGQGVMGTDCAPIRHEMKIVKLRKNGEMFILGERILVQSENPHDVKKRTLEKLTPEEKDALGLK